MRVGGHYSLLANARQIYGAMAIKSVHIIARKTIMTVEAAGLSGSGRWCKTINLVCLALYRTVAEFKGDCNFKSASNTSNYGTASYKSISISIIPGFTTSQSQVCNVCKQRKDDSLKFKLRPIRILHLAILPNCQKGRSDWAINNLLQCSRWSEGHLLFLA